MKKTLMALTVLAVAIMPACSSSEAETDDVYRVMISAGLSSVGPLANNAATSVLAARAGVEQINNAGGIGGRQVELTVVDDAGEPSTAVTKLRQALTSSGKPDLYLSSGPSTVSAAVLPILDQKGVLSFNIAPTADSGNPETFPLNFDLAPSISSFAAGIVAHAKDTGYRSIGVIHGSSATGELFGTSLATAAANAGVAITGNEQYDGAALDMTSQLVRLQSGRPDVLVIDAYGSPLGFILRDLTKLGWNVPLIGDVSVAATELVSSLPPEGLVGTPSVKNLTMQVAASARFDPSATVTNAAVEAMAALGSIESTLGVAYNYDALPLVQAAADAAGSTDPSKIAASLEDPQVTAKASTAIIPHYSFSPSSHSFGIPVDQLAFVPPSVRVNGQFGGPQQN